MSLSFPSIWVPGSSFILASCLIGKEAISSILLDQWLYVVASERRGFQTNINIEYFDEVSYVFDLIMNSILKTFYKV